MTRQQRLFDLPVPARASSPPQLEAAAAVAPHAGDQARRILRALAMAGAMTREEICGLTGIMPRAACGRLREMECPDRYVPALLARSPMVRKVGRRKGSCGIAVYVYEITAAGREVL